MPGVRIKDARIARVASGHMLMVGLADGRVLGLPLFLFPTLMTATKAEREDLEVVGKGHGIHWPRLDLDLSALGLLAGRPDFSVAAAKAAKQANIKSYFRSLAAFAGKRAG